MSEQANLTIRGHVVAHPPNLPLALAVAGLVASWILSDGSTAWDVSRAIFHVSLGIWGYLELTAGVNAFRRALGAILLAYAVASVAGLI